MVVRIFLVGCLIAPLVQAQPVTVSGSVRLRAEAWNWFETRGFEDDYEFFASLIRASVAQQRAGWSWQIEAAQPALFALPDDAIAPPPRGQLGLGASYYAANGEEDAAGLFIKQAWARFDRAPFTLRVGRFEFAEGAETTPGNARLARLKQERVAQRLIGPFGFSHVGRSFEGAQATWSRAPLQATLVAARPTAGAFRVHGGSTLDDVGFVYASLNRAAPAHDSRLFAVAYADDRPVVATDNRPAPVRSADRNDVGILTVGAHHLRTFGAWDVLGWAAIQTGEWGSLDHEAYAFALEGGRHFARGALRAGAWVGSGDDDPADGEHGTFFQILPTPRIYARFPFYNAMNLEDVFLEASFQATPAIRLTSELHRLRLQSDADLWYAGGGAFEEGSFGFAGRPASGASDLATTVDLGVQVALGPKTALGLYAGYGAGGEVVESIFRGRNSSFTFVELVRRFP